MKSDSATRRQFFKTAALAAAGSGFSGVDSHAADQTANDGTPPFWTGKDLTGWHLPPEKIAHGTGGRWVVDEEGVLTGEQDPPGSGNGGLLLSDYQIGDFELKLEMRPDWGPCSGVFFRCNDLGHGFQTYVDYHDNGNVGHLRGEMPGAFALMPFKISLGPDGLDANGDPTSLITHPDPRAEKWPEGVYERVCTPEDWLEAWHLDDWNHLTIRCAGKYPRVTTTINGLEACHWNGATCTLPGYDKEKVFGLLGRSGSIGLQVHGGKGWPNGKKCRWRNLSIRHLSQDEVKQA